MDTIFAFLFFVVCQYTEILTFLTALEILGNLFLIYIVSVNSAERINQYIVASENGKTALVGALFSYIGAGFMLKYQMYGMAAWWFGLPVVNIIFAQIAKVRNLKNLGNNWK